jgi:uncharacterized protein YyaL (SSP411 family)
MKFGLISPQDWGLPISETSSEEAVPGLGFSYEHLGIRIRANTHQWLPRHFSEEVGAFHGFYSAKEKRFEPPQTVNLIASWQALAAFDRYQDERYLTMAKRATHWFHDHFVVTHPMSPVAGGVFESLQSKELWTKFSAEFITLNLGLYLRDPDEAYLERAMQSARFLIQSARHGYAPKYCQTVGEWSQRGWNSFGRVVEAFLELEAVTGDPSWGGRAEEWGAFGLSLQAQDGCYYLIDNDYFNTDIAADELRALVFLYEKTQEQRYLQGAERFTAWLLAWQREDGAWPLTIDRDGNVVIPTVGPGDIPNIAIALIRLHAVTNNQRYFDAAVRSMRYSLSTQVLPDSDHPYCDDLNAVWGFWSWDPYYDFTLSADQSTHHIRGLMFLLDYLHASESAHT